MMRLQHEVEIGAAIDTVFDFVADPRNDPQWCPRVEWCRQVTGTRLEVGARFEAYEHPSLRRAQGRVIEIVALDPPNLAVTRQVDEQGEFTIEYRLQGDESGTRLEQRDRVSWTLPRLIVPLAERIVSRHIRHQLEGLRRLLETPG